MKLYETNIQIAALIEQLQPDPETGEMPDNVDEIIDQLHGLQAERAEILQWIAQETLNLKADAAKFDAEEKRLHQARKDKERVVERLLNILDRECGGQNTDLGIAKLTYRRTARTEIINAPAAVEFLESSGHDDVLKYSEPAIDKTKAKTLIKSGVQIPGVKIVESVSMSLK